MRMIEKGARWMMKREEIDGERKEERNLMEAMRTLSLRQAHLLGRKEEPLGGENR